MVISTVFLPEGRSATMGDMKRYWVAFNRVHGIGAVRFASLLERFGDLESAWNASPQALVASGIGPLAVQRLLEARAACDLDVEMARLEKAGVEVVTWLDESYPRQLRQAPHAPPVIYLRGRLVPADDRAVAVVGTRTPTPYGQSVARDLAAALAVHGVTVVSGLARGIDAISHRAALEAGGRTMAILGSGLDQIYPAEHRQLAEEIVEHGALLSDYALGTRPEAANFPPRNRIISGLARAVVVVEAGEESGALITARFAADQGRDVFAVPGSIYHRASRGTNRLIQDGAAPMLAPEDVLKSLESGYVPLNMPPAAAETDDPIERAVLGCLGSEPSHIDEVVALAGRTVPEVTAALAMLELKGLVTHVGAMNYVRSGASAEGQGL
ncbi:MAG TPA: DNA-processing protein DprA [Anaerolineales bacterium]|nr:DNA-processing protein DprA [Anaerolineales bacterium]